MIGVDRIRIHDKNKIKAIKASVFDYVHMLNMVKILFKKAWDKRHYHITDLMKSKYNMRAFCCNQKGGKQAEQVAILREYFKDDPVYHSIQHHYTTKCNEKNLTYVIGDWIKDVKNETDKGSYSFPKTRKIHTIDYFSFNLDKSKYKIDVENKRLILKLGKAREDISVFLNYDNLQPHTLKMLSSIRVCYKLGHIEIHFGYESEHEKLIKASKKSKKKYSIAGLDLGLCNTFCLFVNDKTTPSLTFDGQSLIQYNSRANYRIAKLQRLIHEYGINGYIDGTKGGKIPLYNDYQKHLKKKINDTFYWRDHFYDDVFHKMSKRILEYCHLNNVIKLNVSRNLAFAKLKGEIHMNKKTKQKFYQIPFMRLIEKLKEKAKPFGIIIDDSIDEAYSSKTSPFVNIHEVVKQANAISKKKEKLSSKVYGGRREGRFFYVNGKGKKCQQVLNSDCVGALNHIRLGDKDEKLTDFCLSKLTQPITIKSTEDFFNFIDTIQRGYSIVSKVHSDKTDFTYNGMLKRLTKNLVQTK